MRIYNKKSFVSESFPLSLGECWNVVDGRGRIVERWTVIKIDKQEKRKTFSARIDEFVPAE